MIPNHAGQHNGRYRHGMAGTRIYQVWATMIQRCQNPLAASYKNYGGRGIAVCERWRDFINFHTDMGDPPEGKTLDRYPNNDGNYELDNCRWATREEQMESARKVRRLCSNCGSTEHSTCGATHWTQVRP